MQTEASNPTHDRQFQGSRGLSLWDEQSSGSRKGLLEWWYRLAAPVEPQDSTPQDRERVRAGKLSSIILLTAMVITLGAFIANRRGNVMAAGIVVVCVVELAFIMVVLTTPTGLSSRSLTIFYLLVLTEVIAVSLLPPRSVFLIALCNMVFTWAAITFMHKTPDLTLVTAPAYYSALASPLVLQIIVALVTYLWVQGARQAIERAERVAALERALAERDRAAAEQKQQLEQGIQQILQTHIQAANGNFDARAPLARENVLWQVAYGLNNLLARLQRATQSEYELQRTEAEVARLVTTVRSAKAMRRLIQAPKSGTILDPLAQELSGNYINQP